MSAATVTEVFTAVGRRKTASARIRLSRGEGKVLVNGKPCTEYLYSDQLYSQATTPLRIAELEGQIDLAIRVEGGGPTGQAGAISHGIARALQKMDPELRTPLKRAGLITRDPRMKERKKPGKPGARKSFQFSKR